MSGVLQAIFYNNPDCCPPIINSTRLLARQGIRVELICRENGQQWGIKYPPEVRIKRLNARGGSWREYLGFVGQAFRYGHSQTQMFIGHDMHGFLPARLLAWRYRKPLIYHCHDFAENGRSLSLGSHMVRLFERRFAQTSDLVIVPDAERGEVVRSQLRLTAPLFIVANAPLKDAAQAGRISLSEALHVKGYVFDQIVFRQGSLGPYHAIEPTIRSMPMWIDSKWGFVVMGQGDQRYIDTLAQLAIQCGVGDRFVMLPPVGYDDVPDFTKGAQLGHGVYLPVNVNHVYATTASNKIMEYLAAGLPVLASDRPGLRKLIETYDCGITADESSPESIAHAVNTLLGDPDLARRQGQNGRRAFEEVFCYERQFAPVLEVLEKLCSTR